MAVKYKDYYDILGVSRKASDAEIKKAFRKLAREHHPDVAKNKKQAEEKFKEANEAYEVLGDPEKRKKYDELGPNWQAGADFRPPPGWGGGRSRTYTSRGPNGEEFEFQFGGTGFSDFFEQVFGGRGGGGSKRRSGMFTHEDLAAEKGQDLEGDILVTLQEAVAGSIRSVSIRQNSHCLSCGGTGVRGRSICSDCKGTGQVEQTHSYQVKIPAGVTEGQRLRVPGRGQAGASGGAAGDLYLRVRMAKHPDFDVEGRNLLHELDLAPWEAVLGADISVPTLSGTVNIRISPGTQNGQKLRLRGRGLPARDGDNGDLIVQTRIEVPAKASDAERELWEKLAKASSFNPRRQT